MIARKATKTGDGQHIVVQLFTWLRSVHFLINILCDREYQERTQRGRRRVEGGDGKDAGSSGVGPRTRALPGERADGGR